MKPRQALPPLILPRSLTSTKFRVASSDEASAVEYQGVEEFFDKRVHITTPVFAVILSGRKVVRTESGEETFSRGDGFVSMGGEFLYSEMHADAEPFKSLLFFISDNKLQNFLEGERAAGRLPAKNLQDGQAAGPILRVRMTPLMTNAAVSALSCLEQDIIDSSRLIDLKIEEILLTMANSPDRDILFAFVESRLSRAPADLAECMSKNFDKPFTLGEFASLTSRSLSAFKRDFAAAFNQPPKAWINKKRLRKARSLLEFSDATVTEVCFESGFENPSYFATIFKKEFGAPPSKFKRK